MDPEVVSDEVDRTVSTLAGHKEVSSPQEWSVVEPVDVHSIDCDGLVSAVDNNALVNVLLITSYLVVERLVHIAALHDLDCVWIELLDGGNGPVTLGEVTLEGPLGCLGPVCLGEGVLGDHVFVGFEPETCHLFSNIIFIYNLQFFLYLLL